MKPFPERPPEVEEPSDAALIHFLRQHRPQGPPPAPDLEERLMAALEDPAAGTAIPGAGQIRAIAPRAARLRWLVPITLAASLVAGWCSYRVLLPPTDPEVASLEAFVESAWSAPEDNAEDNAEDTPEADAHFVSQLLAEPSPPTAP